jgi:hypothetical protein
VIATVTAPLASMINELNVAVPPPKVASLARQYSPSPKAERIFSTVAGDSTDKSNVRGITGDVTGIEPAAKSFLADLA